MLKRDSELETHRQRKKLIHIETDNERALKYQMVLLENVMVLYSNQPFSPITMP